jgi:hypothetical protein
MFLKLRPDHVSPHSHTYLQLCLDSCGQMVRCQPYPRLPRWRSYLAQYLYSLSSMVWYADQPANMLTFGDLPENSTAYFKSPPSERGTLNILSTCIFTLVLCVYTCLHLNILPHKATKWYQKKWGSKTIGILLGLLAPEIVSSRFLYQTKGI